MGRCSLLFCRLTGVERVLLLPCLLTIALSFGTIRPADAQAGDTHLAFSEVVYDLDGTDRTREYIEIANLGTREWDPRGHWIWRWVAREGDPKDQKMIQITGPGAANLKPIPPGGVLLIEWLRPNADEDFPAQQGANVFGTGSPTDAELDTNDLESRMYLALFAPQSEAPTLPADDATFGGARMLAFFATNPLHESFGTDANYGANIGMKRAAELGLWELGKPAPAGYDWATTLRWPAPAPGQPVPPQVGRRASDYYLTRYGLPDLSQATRGKSDPGQVLPRYGTPGAPNLQFPGQLVPGQTLANGRYMEFYEVAATAATTAAGSPATAVHIAAVDGSGAIGVNLLTGDTWAGWQFVGGPALGKPVFVDNPKTGGRLLAAIDAITGQLYVNRFAVVGSDPAFFTGWRPIGGRATGTPVVAIDPATGNEAIAFNDPAGQTMVVTSQAGVFSAPQPLPGNSKLVDLAIAHTPSGLAVLGFEGGQLKRSLQSSTGAFGDLANVAGPLGNRGPYLATVARFNPVAGQLEVLATGENGALQHTRVKLGVGGAADVVSAWAPVGINTDSTPGMAVNTDTGDVMVIAREADLPIPEGEKLKPTGGQARIAMFRNGSGKFDPPTRIGVGLMPAGASPDAAYNPNTKQYEQFLVGEDNLIYRNTVAP